MSVTITCPHHCPTTTRRSDRARAQLARIQLAADARRVERRRADHATYIAQLRAKPDDQLTGVEKIALFAEAMFGLSARTS